MKRIPFVLVLGLLCFGTKDLLASDPVGIYAVIEKVVFEPSENAPQRIQVWGAFAISDAKPGDNYGRAQRGYLYLRLPPGREESAKKEWADLKRVAGTGQAIGFGGKYSMRVRLRRPDEAPASPDAHPLGMGVIKVADHPQKAPHQDSVVASLKELVRPKQ
jgi:hypothetical protein